MCDDKNIEAAIALLQRWKVVSSTSRFENSRNAAYRDLSAGVMVFVALHPELEADLRRQLTEGPRPKFEG